MPLLSVLDTLNWFLLLEKSQVYLYGGLAKAAQDEETKHALLQFQDTESEHVDTLTTAIERMGGSPSKISLGAGFLSGLGLVKALSMLERWDVQTAPIISYKSAAAFERRAIKDYHALLDRVEHGDLRDILWRHLIEEDLHALWLARKVDEMQYPSSH